MAECCNALDDDDVRLTDLFDNALEMYENIIKSDEASSSSKLQREIKNCIKLLEKATHLINAAGVFSSNETINEVSSQNVKYLLIPALLGNLVLKVQSPDRMNALETSEIYFKDFLKRIKEYEIIDSINLEEQEDERDSIPQQMNLQQLAMQRNEKLRKYKEQKEAEAELKRLKSLMISDDDEICRNYFLKYIKNFINTSLDELHLIKQEKPLAKHLSEMRAKGTSLKMQEKDEKPNIRPLKPIIITRNEVQKKVFGAGYPSLPTMTVDEFYRERVAEGIFPAHGSSHGKVLQEMTDPEVVKQDEEREEIEKENEIETDDPNYLEKARRMDEFKDTHKRGWGNRMNRS
ncbi:hypothetical protein RUM44_004303 [Polyplax serrata]|uniref:Uncharacterized protein n=1 Tax=Polyplax serrata TaxID=468196 RepID=A0ABR1B2F6_POLSC